MSEYPEQLQYTDPIEVIRIPLATSAMSKPNQPAF